jgi:hypothetical protein
VRRAYCNKSGHRPSASSLATPPSRSRLTATGTCCPEPTRRRRACWTRSLTPPRAERPRGAAGGAVRAGLPAPRAGSTAISKTVVRRQGVPRLRIPPSPFGEPGSGQPEPLIPPTFAGLRRDRALHGHSSITITLDHYGPCSPAPTRRPPRCSTATSTPTGAPSESATAFGSPNFPARQECRRTRHEPMCQTRRPKS